MDSTREDRRGWADWVNEKAEEGLGFREGGSLLIWTLPDGKKLVDSFSGLTHTRLNGVRFVVADDLLAHEDFCLKQATFRPVCWMTLNFAGFSGLITQMVLGCNYHNDPRMRNARTELIIHYTKGPVWPAEFKERLGAFPGSTSLERIEHRRLEPGGMSQVSYTSQHGRRFIWTQYLSLGTGPRRLIGELVVDFDGPSIEFLGKLTREFGFPKEILESI